MLCISDESAAVGLAAGVVVVASSTAAPTVLSSSSSSRVVGVASAGPWLVVAFATKEVKCFEESGGGAVCGERLAPRRPSALAIHDGCALVACGGELYASPLPSLDREAWLLGHTSSVITAVAAAGGLVATADRNEKIRLSRWPQTAIIDAYCLGHRSFVSRVRFVHDDDARLVSAGGDGALILWTRGEETRKVDHDEPLTCLAVARDGRVAVASQKDVFLYEDFCGGGDDAHAADDLLSSKPPTPPTRFATESAVVDLCFDDKDDALIALVADAKVVLRRLGADGTQSSALPPRLRGAVDAATREGLAPPTTALHALDTIDPQKDDAEENVPPIILRKHTIDLRVDVSVLGNKKKAKTATAASSSDKCRETDQSELHPATSRGSG